jgi:hypothetical protein
MITSPYEFKRLRESTDPAEYCRAVSDEASLEVWREILEEMPEMRFWVAQNKTVPIEILDLLATSPDAQVRDMVARKRKITESIAIRLAADPDEIVRAALARNLKLPGAALDILQRDRSPLVQDALAVRNKNG